MNTENFYTHPQEVWSVAKCTRLARGYYRDGMGTRMSWPGYIGWLGVGKTVRYNGGKIIDGEWYQGEIRPLPKVPEGFTIVNMATWGWRLIKLPEPVVEE